MKKIFSIFAALTLSIGLWAEDHYFPIELDASTLNGDVVMGKNQTKDSVWEAGHSGVGLDGYACFYSNNCQYVDSLSLDHGLPASVYAPNTDGVDIPFKFTWTGSEQFDGHDAIHLVSNGEAVTVDFKGGNAFKGLYFLATAGNVEGGSSPITVTITYVDGTSTVSSFNILDWFYDGDKPANALQQFYRWSSYNSVNYDWNGPCLYCLSLNDALDPLKPIKSLTFTQANDEMCTAIFAITGILNGCTPQAPQNISGNYDGTKTTITFDEVTKDMDSTTITGVTYVYDVARDPNFVTMVEGHTNKPLTVTVEDGTVTGTINAHFKGLYIRVRAKNTCGVSLNSDVIVDEEAEYFTVTIPESTDYYVLNYISGARYIPGETVTFTAQVLVDGKDVGGWKNNHETPLSTTSQLSLTITQDTTIIPVLKPEERSYEIASGVTAQMGTLDKDYPWIKTITKPGLAYASTNMGVDDAEYGDTLTIIPEAGKYYRLKFDYAVSSEGYEYDTMSVWVNNVKIADRISGRVSGSYDSNTAFLITPGQTATIVMSYGKDGGGNDGDDRGYIYNIQVISYDTRPAIYTVTVLENEGGVVTGLVPDGKYISGDEVSLTATPNNIASEFKEWQDSTGNKISTANPLTFAITQDTTIKPIFKVEKRSFTIATGVTAQMGTLDKDYPWIKTTAKPGLAYMSTNKNMDNTESIDMLTITPEAGVSYRVRFDCAVSSEEGCDWMYINMNGTPIGERISGQASRSYDSGETLLTEPTTFEMKYGKDYSVSDGEDRGYIYNIVVTSDAPDPVYTRDVTNESWGTICLPWESIALEGGDFYNVLGTKDAELGVALTPIEAPDQLEAGKPYVFKATSNQIKVTYDPTTEVEDSVYAGNHIYGSFAGCTVPNGKYIIYNNLLYKTDGSSTVGANRAYFDVTNMGTYDSAHAPARVVFMGGHQVPTDIEVHNARCTMHDGRYLINGQFVIIRDGKTYNAQGIEL